MYFIALHHLPFNSFLQANNTMIQITRSSFYDVNYGLSTPNGATGTLNVQATGFTRCPYGIFTNTIINSLVVSNSWFTDSDRGVYGSLNSAIGAISITGTNFTTATLAVYYGNVISFLLYRMIY